MKNTFITILILGIAVAKADIFTQVQRVENTFSEPFYLAGEKSKELTPKMQARKENLEIRLKYPDAWKYVKEGNVDEFSYFGFKLDEVKQGTLSLKEFLEELQKYLER